MSYATATAKLQSSAQRAVMDPSRAVISIIILGSLIRIAVAAAFGLGSDESYTVANARHFALSYVDYPPLHAWIVGAWSWLCGSEAPFVVRLPFIALFAGSTWMMYRLTARLFDARAGMWAALLFNLAPVFMLPHASWVLPDGPLIFFMLCSTFVVAGLLFAETPPTHATLRWILAGALAGLAMLSKYHGAFVLAGVFVFLLSFKPARALLATPGPWLGAATALLIFSPVILWNAEHDWVGLFFQSSRLTTSRHLDVTRIFGGIAGQAGYLTPWIFVPLAIVWIRALMRGTAEPRRWFLALIASGPIVFFTLANIVSAGLPHWPMPGWLFVFPMLGVEAARIAETRPRLLYGAAAASAALLMSVIALLATNARTGWLVSYAPPRYLHTDPTLDLLNWSELHTALSERHLLDADAPVIAATRWQEAGKLNYIMGRKVHILCLCTDPQQFRYLQTPERFEGRNIIIIGAHRDVGDMGSELPEHFDRIETLDPIILHRAGRNAIDFTVVRGINFHAAPVNKGDAG